MDITKIIRPFLFLLAFYLIMWPVQSGLISLITFMHFQMQYSINQIDEYLYHNKSFLIIFSKGISLFLLWCAGLVFRKELKLEAKFYLSKHPAQDFFLLFICLLHFFAWFVFRKSFMMDFTPSLVVLKYIKIILFFGLDILFFMIAFDRKGPVARPKILLFSLISFFMYKKMIPYGGELSYLVLLFQLYLLFLMTMNKDGLVFSLQFLIGFIGLFFSLGHTDIFWFNYLPKGHLIGSFLLVLSVSLYFLNKKRGAISALRQDMSKLDDRPSV